MEIFPHRMKRLIAPAKDHGKLVLMHTDGKMDDILPILYDVGIDVNHPIEPESNDIVEVKKKWAGKMALIGNVHTPLLAYGTKDEIEAKVREYCEKLGPGGGYVLRLVYQHHGRHPAGELRGHDPGGASVWAVWEFGGWVTRGAWCVMRDCRIGERISH